MRLVAQNQDSWGRQTGHAVCPPSCWPPVTIHQPWALANSTIKSEFALASSTIHAHAIRKSKSCADADVLEHLMPDVVAGDECDPWSSMASRAAEVEPGTGHTPTGVFVAPAWHGAENERIIPTSTTSGR